jgi:hypothetical protein
LWCRTTTFATQGKPSTPTSTATSRGTTSPDSAGHSAQWSSGCPPFSSMSPNQGRDPRLDLPDLGMLESHGAATIGEPWTPGSLCEFVLISRPYAFGSPKPLRIFFDRTRLLNALPRKHRKPTRPRKIPSKI